MKTPICTWGTTGAVIEIYAADIRRYITFQVS